MRYVVARIVSPPRRVFPYLKNRKKQLEGWVKKAKKLLVLVSKYKRDENFDSFLVDVLDSPNRYIFDRVEWIIERVCGEHGSITGVIRGINDILEHGGDPEYGPKFVGRLVARLKVVESSPHLEEMGQIVAVFEEERERTEVAVRDVSFYKEEGIDVLPWIKLLKDTEELFKTFSVKVFCEKMAELKKRIDMSRYVDKGYKPETKDIETLFHTTAYKKEILRKGFKKEPPQGRVGLGGSDVEKRVSFTSDLYIAKEISRCLKEAIMIARNELKWAQIFDWMKRERINPKKCPHRFPPENLGDVFHLYQCYLALSKIRENPVFFSDAVKVMKEFSKRKQSDVGILKCEVAVKDPGVEYLPGESEFRVPPKAVLNIKLLK